MRRLASLAALALGALALLAAGGCGDDDLCSGSDLGTTLCLTLHLHGSVNSGHQISLLQIDTRWTDNGAQVRHRTRSVPDSDAGAVSLPLELPVVFSSSLARLDGYSSSLVIVAYDGSEPVGLGYHSFRSSHSTKNSPHAYVDVELLPVEKDETCFDTVPPQCGTYSNCPLCELGASCSTSSDCADYEVPGDVVCNYDTGYVCTYVGAP